MLNILRIVFSLIGALLATYSLIKDKYPIMSLSFICLGLSILISGVTDLKNNRKSFAYTSFLASSFVIFVGIYIFVQTVI